MTISDVCRVMRIRRQTVYDMIKSGVLTSFKRGRLRFVTDVAVRAAITHLETVGMDAVNRNGPNHAA